MLKKLIKFLIATLLWATLLPTPKSLAAGSSWYLNNQATCSSCTGKSWESAWKSFASVVWGQGGINPGDTLYIAGSSTPYIGPLNIPSLTATTGTITITKGESSPYNSEVKIDGQSGYGIRVNTGQAVTIRGLSFINSNGIYVNGVSSSNDQGLLIDSCRFTDFRRAGVFVDSANQVTIKNSYFDDANENLYTEQSDGIYAQLTTSLIVDNNTIILDNNYLANEDLHSDNIQTYYVKNVTYSNNVLIQNSQKTKGTQMLFTEEGGKSDTDPNSASLGVHYMYNNVLLRNCPNAMDGAIRLKNGKGTYFKPRVVNNTYYGVAGRILNVSTTLTDSLVKNNLFSYTNSGDTIPSSLDATNLVGSKNNLDPKFANATLDYKKGFDFHLLPQSPAINRGLPVTTSVQYDRDGVLRDSKWDAGAYEYTTATTPSFNIADINTSGSVDYADYAILLTNFGKTGSPGFIRSDIVADGHINLYDFNQLVVNFGK